MRTAAASAPDTARKTPSACDASPSKGSWTQCPRDPATTEQKCPLRLRLPQNDGKHTAKTPPLNPSLPSTGRPNQTAGSSPGPVPPELSATPTDHPNPAVHPGINTRGPSTNLPCPIRHAHKRRNPSMMPANPTHELICPGRHGAGPRDTVQSAIIVFRTGIAGLDRVEYPISRAYDSRPSGAGAVHRAADNESRQWRSEHRCGKT